MSSANIELDNVQKSYGSLSVISGLTAQIEAGKFTVILGPSGCGKSTLLNMIAGLEEITSGRILIGGREVQNDAPKDRGLAMVFQNYALYPHMSVAENIGYALKIAGVSKDERKHRVEQAAAFVDLAGYLDRRPKQLSGGQRQRVAIARAIVREPEVLLYDEPLSNLDAKLRNGMRMELSELHKRIGATSVFVTHDQVEAMTLADRIMILKDGEVEQYGTPHDIYHRPATTFVAGFIGAPPMNLLDAEIERGAVKIGGAMVGKTDAPDGPVRLGIRPEKITIATDGLETQLVYSEDLGSHTVLTVEGPDGHRFQLATSLGSNFRTVSSILIDLAPEHIHLFNSEDGQRLDFKVR